MQKRRKKSVSSIESYDSTSVRSRRRSKQIRPSEELSLVSEELSNESEYAGILPHPRTDELLRDYHEFKAARIIQKYARCWYNRVIYQRKRRAAMIIQHAWRGFYYPQRFYYRYVECLLQHRIEKHFNDNATKIQAWWRGWFVRLHVHDHYALKREQLRLAEEMLQCVAYKLHHLIRTKQIPGIYSVYNSQALSKIEKLIAAFSFKQFHGSEMNQIEYAKLKPFDAEKVGKSATCRQFYKQKDVDTQMYNILKLYDTSMQENEQVAAYFDPKKKQQLAVTAEKPVSSFCTEIVNILNRWKILKDNNTKFDVAQLKDAEKLDKFLTELRSIYERMKYTSCICCRPKIQIN